MSGGGGGGTQWTGAQPACAVFHPGQLKNGSFWNLFFWYCDHSKWPAKLCKACFRPYLRVFNPIWVLGRGGGGVSQGIGTQPAYALFHYGQLKNRIFRNLCFWCCDHLKWPSKVCKACFRPYLRVFDPIWVLGPGGGGPKGWVHNLLMQFLTLGSSKIEVFRTYFFDMVITESDHLR